MSIRAMPSAPKAEEIATSCLYVSKAHRSTRSGLHVSAAACTVLICSLTLVAPVLAARLGRTRLIVVPPLTRRIPAACFVGRFQVLANRNGRARLLLRRRAVWVREAGEPSVIRPQLCNGPDARATWREVRGRREGLR